MDKKKLENFWYYYKFHVLFAAFAVFVLVLIVSACLRNTEDATFVLVDSTNYIYREHADEMLSGLAEYNGDSKDEYSFAYPNEFADVKNDMIADAANIKEFKDFIAEGNISALVAVRTAEYDIETVGNLEEILPKDLMDILKEKDVIVNYLEKDEEGNYKDTDVICGILINDSEVMQKVIGEVDSNLVLQIPVTVKEKENAIAFVRYLFGL